MNDEKAKFKILFGGSGAISLECQFRARWLLVLRLGEHLERDGEMK